MTYSIKQSVGNLSTGSTVSLSITPSSGSKLWVIGVGDSNGQTISLTNSGAEAVNLIGSFVNVEGTSTSLQQAYIDNVSATAHTLEITSANNCLGLVVVEIAGVATGASEQYLTVTGTNLGSGPYYTTSGNTASVSIVPAAVLAYVIDASGNAVITGPGTGFNADSVTWQGTAPTSGNNLVEDLRLTSAGVTAATAFTSNQYDSFGIAVAVFAEASSGGATQVLLHRARGRQMRRR